MGCDKVIRIKPKIQAPQNFFNNFIDVFKMSFN